jgi:xanthine dehydrogenase YagS FAD-binding subunit
MNRFEVLTPVDLAHASRLLAERGRVALAGGVDLVDLMNQNVVAPESLVNLKGLPGMDAIEPAGNGGLKIGALAKLHDVANSATVRQRYEAIAMAAEEAATRRFAS